MSDKTLERNSIVVNLTQEIPEIFLWKKSMSNFQCGENEDEFPTFDTIFSN